MSGFLHLPGQYPGTATNDSANAGNIGEFLSSSASGVSLVSLTAKTIASKSFTAGEWRVQGSIIYRTATSTAITSIYAMLSAADNTADTTLGKYNLFDFGASPITPGNLHDEGMLTPTWQLQASGATTVYLVALSQFATDTLTASGIIFGTRVR